MPQLPSELTNLAQIAGFIREHAQKQKGIIFLPHARKAMTDDQVSAVEVRNGLKGCSVVRHEAHGFSWRSCCRCKTRQGEPIEVVIEIIDPGLREEDGEEVEEEPKL